MKSLKKIVLALLVAVSMGGVSTTAFAEASEGRISYQPAEAIDILVKKIKVALDAITSGAEGEAVAKLIKEASDMSKEINANDKVDIARAKATATLKSARKHAQQESLQEAEQELRKAEKQFSDLKGML